MIIRCLCAFVQHGGCGYVEWHDNPLPEFFSNLLGDMRDEIWRLKGQGAVARNEDEGPIVGGNADATRDVLVQSLQDEVAKKNAELVCMKAKYQNVVFVCFVFVVGLVAGKLFMQ